MEQFQGTAKHQIAGTFKNKREIGKIDKVLHDDERGADGFLKYDGTKSVYFRVDASEEIKGKIRVGLDVEFEILAATENKKAKAVQLRAK